MRAWEMINSLGYLNLLLLVILIICGYTDLKERRILNIVVLPAILIALLFHLAQGGFAGAIFWGKGTLAGLALLFIPFALGGLGAGDVKLLGVVGAFKGAGFVLMAFLYAAILGGIFALFLLIKKKRLKKTLCHIGNAFKVFCLSRFRIFNLAHLEQERIIAIPYGVAIALGAIVCLVGERLC